MIRKIAFITVLVCSMLASGLAFADSTFSIEASYLTPIGNNMIDPSLSIGVEYRFWGIFTVSGAMYNNVVMGGDNIFGISAIQPIGLFSGGVGIRIPLGGFHVFADWQKFFTGTASSEGVYAFSDSYSYGASFDISNSFGIEVYSRGLFNFSDKATQDSSLRIDSTTETVHLLGVGVSFHLF